MPHLVVDHFARTVLVQYQYICSLPCVGANKDHMANASLGRVSIDFPSIRDAICCNCSTEMTGPA